MITSPRATPRAIVSDDWYATHNWFEVLGQLWLSHVIAQAHREGRVLDGTH